MQQEISEPELYDDLVNRFTKRIRGISEEFRKLINRHNRIVYYPYIMPQTSWLLLIDLWLISMFQPYMHWGVRI